ncbi:hypothetical protein BgiMline_032264, partial [Biomphalaria glabrata]
MDTLPLASLLLATERVAVNSSKPFWLSESLILFRVLWGLKKTKPGDLRKGEK